MSLVGAPDLFGRPMRVTEVAFADEIAAAASLVLWVGVIFWGRMLPFLGTAF